MTDAEDRKFFLDISKFQLEAFKAQTNAQVQLLDAYGKYNLKMQEVIGKQIKNAQEYTKLEWLQLQLLEYRRALAENRHEQMRVKARLARVERSIRRAAMLALGEIIEPDLVSLAWQGFFALIADAPFDAKLVPSRMEIPPEIRRAGEFARPRNLDREVEPPPETIRHALALFQWSRRASVVPRAGSLAQEKLQEALAVLDIEAKQSLKYWREEVEQAERELVTLQSVLWKTVPVEKLKPKTTSSSSKPPITAASIPDLTDAATVTPRTRKSSSSKSKASTAASN